MTDTKQIQPVVRDRQRDRRRWMTVVVALGMIVLIALCVWGWKAGIFTSHEKLGAFLDRMGVWAPLVFVLLQIAQTIVAIIPGAVTCIMGVAIFGPVQGFIYNYVGIVLGSCVVFALARRYGRSLVQMLVSPKLFEKYEGWLEHGQKRFTRLFAAAIFLPFSPDDLICMLAGLSAMKGRTFVLIVVLCKPLFLIPYSLGVPSLTALLGRLLG